MDSNIKKLWLNALRSGEYKQATGNLRKDDTFCCLGVLCDLYAKQNNVEWKLRLFESGRMEILDEWSWVPDSILNWAGFAGGDYKLVRKHGAIPKMNDKQGKSFKEIADFIEEKL